VPDALRDGIRRASAEEHFGIGAGAHDTHRDKAVDNRCGRLPKPGSRRSPPHRTTKLSAIVSFSFHTSPFRIQKDAERATLDGAARYWISELGLSGEMPLALRTRGASVWSEKHRVGIWSRESRSTPIE